MKTHKTKMTRITKDQTQIPELSKRLLRQRARAEQTQFPYDLLGSASAASETPTRGSEDHRLEPQPLQLQLKKKPNRQRQRSASLSPVTAAPLKLQPALQKELPQPGLTAGLSLRSETAVTAAPAQPVRTTGGPVQPRARCGDPQVHLSATALPRS